MSESTRTDDWGSPEDTLAPHEWVRVIELHRWLRKHWAARAIDEIFRPRWVAGLWALNEKERRFAVEVEQSFHRLSKRLNTPARLPASAEGG